MKIAPYKRADLDEVFRSIGRISLMEAKHFGLNEEQYKALLLNEIAGGRAATLLMGSSPAAVYVETTYSSFVSTDDFFIESPDRIKEVIRTFSPFRALARSRASSPGAVEWMRQIGFTQVGNHLFLKEAS